MSIKSVDSQLQDLMQASRSKPLVVYAGASWCSPCKAMRPLVLIKAEAAHDCELVELDLSDYEQGFDSQYIRSLPAFLRIEQGEILQSLNGMLTSQQLTSLFSGEAEKSAQQAEEQLNQQYLMIRGQIENQQLDQAQTSYQQLPAELKYHPRLQRLKSWCDLIIEAKAKLGDQTGRDDFTASLQAFAAGDTDSGLQQFPLQTLQTDTARELFIHAINSIEDSEQAALWRKYL